MVSRLSEDKEIRHKSSASDIESARLSPAPLSLLWTTSRKYAHHARAHGSQWRGASVLQAHWRCNVRIEHERQDVGICTCRPRDQHDVGGEGDAVSQAWSGRECAKELVFFLI